MWFHIWFLMKLYYKIRQTLLQNTTDILSQNTMKVYYKMCQFIQTLLRNVIIITKCDVYYKMRQCTLRATTKSGWIHCLSIRNGKHIKPSIFLTQKISPATISNFYKSPILLQPFDENYKDIYKFSVECHSRMKTKTN